MDRKQNQRVFNKTIDAGYLSEKDIEKMDIWDILQLRDITKKEMEIVAQMQKAIKERRLVGFLAGMTEEEV